MGHAEAKGRALRQEPGLAALSSHALRGRGGIARVRRTARLGLGGWSALALLAGALLAAPRLTGAMAPVPFVSVGQGTRSGILDQREVVIQSDHEWQELWREHAPSSSGPPPVDFAAEVVAGVFAGQRPTSGYRARVVGVELDGGAMTIGYRIDSPPKDAVVAEVLTQPFHLIRLPRHGLPIRFTRR